MFKDDDEEKRRQTKANEIEQSAKLIIDQAAAEELAKVLCSASTLIWVTRRDGLCLFVEAA